MICKDCIHNEVCVYSRMESQGVYERLGLRGILKSCVSCFYFKDKSKIIELPNNDVIHCADCFFWDKMRSYGVKHSKTYACKCKFWSEGGLISQYTTPDDFCSKGERRKP